MAVWGGFSQLIGQHFGNFGHLHFDGDALGGQHQTEVGAAKSFQQQWQAILLAGENRPAQGSGKHLVRRLFEVAQRVINDDGLVVLAAGRKRFRATEKPFTNRELADRRHIRQRG